jgi:hypothetical protein
MQDLNMLRILMLASKFLTNGHLIARHFHHAIMKHLSATNVLGIP